MTTESPRSAKSRPTIAMTTSRLLQSKRRRRRAGSRTGWGRTRFAPISLLRACRGSPRRGSCFPSTATSRAMPRPFESPRSSGRTLRPTAASSPKRCGKLASTPGSRLSTPPRPALVGGSVLEAEHLTKIYRGRKVVNDVALRLQQGEIVGLLGPNGAGKTTTFYMIVGLIQPLAGRILLDGEDITKMPMYQRARRGIGYLSQEPSIFRKLSVEDNILAILETLPLSRERARSAAGDAAGRAEHQAPAAQQGVRAFRRRAAPARDHARAGHAAEVHDAGRAVRRGRPDRRARHPDHRRRTCAIAASAC